MTSPAQQLARALADGGAKHAFGVPGGGPNLDVVGALDAEGIRFVLAHAETAACIMASTYGWLTGSPTAAVVTRGPGAASAVNGAAQATLDRHPLLLVTDTVPSSARTRVPHQRIDQQAMLTPTAKASIVLGKETSVDDMRAAAERAAAIPAGCVHLDYDASAAGDPVQPVEAAVVSGDDTRVAQLIADAQRPVVIVGVGATGAAAEVRTAVERFGAPVLSTYQGVGIVDSEGPLHGGLFTNGASERPLLEQADLIILVGVDFVEPIPAAWAYAAPVVSLAETAAVDPYLPIEVELVGDLAARVEQLLVGAHAWTGAEGGAHRQGVRARLAEAGAPDVFGPVEAVQVVAREAHEQATVTVDAGAHFLAIMPFWPARSPQRLLISNGLATMGYAVPAAIGAALARPDEPVIALTGDGGLGMCLAELETIARLDLPITVVVYNDAALSLIEIKQREGHGGSGAVRYEPTDFAHVATGMGLGAAVAHDADSLAAALRAAEQGPFVIDARIDPGAYPELIAITRG